MGNRVISANDIKEDLNLTVCNQIIWNRLKECGISSSFILKKNFVSEKNRKLQLDWANKYVHWAIEQ